MGNETSLPPSLFSHIPWVSPSDPIWPANCFILRRNVTGFFFPNKLSPEEQQTLLKEIETAFLDSEALSKSLFFPAEKLSVHEKEFLCEHFLSSNAWQQQNRGVAFCLDNLFKFIAIINDVDHLELHVLDCQGSWDKSWETVCLIESSLKEKLKFNSLKEFGYLTSVPHNSGTGLTILSYLHLPLLLKSADQSLLSHIDHDLAASSLFGHQEFIGDFLILKNKKSFEIEEAALLAKMHAQATELSLAEKQLRLAIKDQIPSEIKDHIARAYGLLLHSFELQTQEALDALSQIKLGIDLGCIQGLSDQEINELLFRCRRAHLIESTSILLQTHEIAHARAEFLHEKLRSITLTW